MFVHPVFETKMNDMAAFLSASLHVTRISTHKQGLQRCDSFHYNRVIEDMMEVMICRKLHPAIRYNPYENKRSSKGAH